VTETEDGPHGGGEDELTVSRTMELSGSVRPRERARDTESVRRLERGDSIGRYTILALIGQGGMGEVYAAYDPELDRKVALKLLLGTRDSAADARSQVRLLREAKAIARLSHPNVVVVHDAGTFHERVFLAMEFVDGQTLKEWLAETPRSRREILAHFASAAGGLAAAHAAGLVHRDFKPHNVMVGKDGSVRVMDFGLAREIDPTSPTSPGTPPDAPTSSEALRPPPGPYDNTVDPALTRTGELVGTPLYMAPEQFQSARTDARTDQFSFCVALYQALYGTPPFGEDGLPTLVTRVLMGEVQPPPAKHDVPAWLRRVLLRGLSVDPAARWPSMQALLVALDQDPTRTRRRWGLALGVALLVAASAVAFVRGPRRAESMCRGGPGRLAGLWEMPSSSSQAPRPARDALAAAFARAGGPTAGETWTRVEALLDRYAGAWLTMYRDACEATHARGEQSPETLDLRMSCLDERRGALGALTTVFTHADDAAVANAVDAVNALPDLERCGDVKALRESIEPPRDEATRAKVAQIHDGLSVAKALRDTGKQREGFARGTVLIADARALGYRPLLAEALGTVGNFSDSADGRPGQAALLEESVWTALAVKRDDVAAESGAVLAALVGYTIEGQADGLRWARLTKAVLDRMGPGHERVRGWLMHAQGNLALARGDLPGALEFFRESVALKEKALPANHPDIALSLDSMAEVLQRLGRTAEAVRDSAQARNALVQAYGPSGPAVARVDSNLGERLVAAGRPAEALPHFRDALTHWVPAGASETASIAYPLTGLGQALLALARPGEAVEPLEKALERRAPRKGATGEGDAGEGDATLVAETRFALARALWDSGGDRHRARSLATEANAEMKTAHPADPVAPAQKAISNWLAQHG
jgi:eukaryotic-like serine/threonine-protein kinase